MNVLKIIFIVFLFACAALEFAVARHKHVTVGTCDEHVLTGCGFFVFAAFMCTVLY